MKLVIVIVCLLVTATSFYAPAELTRVIFQWRSVYSDLTHITDGELIMVWFTWVATLATVWGFGITLLRDKWK